mgnify:CR=1 FL=1
MNTPQDPIPHDHVRPRKDFGRRAAEVEFAAGERKSVEQALPDRSALPGKPPTGQATDHSGTSPRTQVGVMPRSSFARVRLAVEGKHIDVLGSSLHEGPDVRPQSLYATSFVEVRAGDLLLTAVAVVDPGVQYSTSAQHGEGVTKGHRVTVLPRYDLVVKVPLSEPLPLDTKVTIALYEARTPVSIDNLDRRRISGRHAPAGLQRVATSRGMTLGALVRPPK